MDSFAAVRFPTLPLSKEAATPPPIATKESTCQAEFSDEILLSNICNGDRESLAVLFRRHVRMVHGIARRMLRDRAEADDLTQDVFLHIARKCQLYDSSRGAARSWIVQVTYYQVLSRKVDLAERQRYGALNLEESGAKEMAAPVIAEYDHSGEGVFGQRRWRRIQEMLTEDQWETVRLYFFEGYTFAEIAQRRNQPVGNIRHHFYRGLSRLRKYIFRDELQGC